MRHILCCISALLLLTGDVVAKTLVSSGDFTYLGSFSVPTIVGENTDYSNGLAYRYVSESLRLYSTALSGSMYEFTPPGILDGRAATLVRNWGDIYSGYRSATGGGSTYTWGLFWDTSSSRMYWVSQNDYDNDGDQVCLGYSTLNDGTGVGTGIGSWKMPSGLGSKIAKGITAIPTAFASSYTSGRRLGIGFGGYESVANAGPASMGMALVAVDPPSVSSGEPLAAGTVLANHPFNATEYSSPWRDQRDTNYNTSFDGWQPNGGIGYWTWVDILRQSCVWLDGSSKEGLLCIARFGTGNVYYAESTVHADSGKDTWLVYDPADLADASQSIIDPDEVVWTSSWDQTDGEPIDQPLTGWSEEGDGKVQGIVYDETAQRLYVLYTWGALAVYQVDIGTADATAPAISSRSPAPDATGVAVDAAISFTLTDAGDGVDISTIVVTVEGGSDHCCSGETCAGGSADLTCTGTAASYAVTLSNANAGGPFSNSQVVSVTADCSDLAASPNAMVQSAWDFTTIGALSTTIQLGGTRSLAVGGTRTAVLQ